MPPTIASWPRGRVNVEPTPQDNAGLDALAQEILAPIRADLAAHGRPFILGLSGLQGSGKSTLAQHLCAMASPCSALALSLDDFYLSRAHRQQLARHVHPLLVTRGVPGTHDVDALHRVLDALSQTQNFAPLSLPQFDKGTDNPVDPSQWPRISEPPRLIVLEGWCLSVPAQTQSALIQPINALEANEDAQGIWRRWVNAKLADEYAGLWQRIDHLVVLQAPGFEVVARWRDQQEQALRDRQAPQAMSAFELARFIAHYERLSRHALTALPALADTLVRLDPQRAACSRWSPSPT